MPDKKKCELPATILQSRSFAFRGECVEEVKDFEGINSFFILFSILIHWALVNVTSDNHLNLLFVVFISCPHVQVDIVVRSKRKE